MVAAAAAGVHDHDANPSSIMSMKLVGGGKPEGDAGILAIATANPANVVEQSSFPDYYFRVTGNEDKLALKEKFRRISNKTTVQKRYIHLTEEMLAENPNMCAYRAPSLDARQSIVIAAVPELAAAAAKKALSSWGRPRSAITHMVFCTMTGADMPGADYRLLHLLGLEPTVQRTMLYHLGCYAAGTALRLAKDLAENNSGARVLVVCSEISAHNFRGPEETDFHNLCGQAIFGDGAAALVVGADPDADAGEKPLFEIVSAAQVVAADSEGAVEGHLREVGLTFHSTHRLPEIIARSVRENLATEFGNLVVSGDWNGIFWAAHPGGPGVLDRVQEELRLEPGKLDASRYVLREYGNMSSPTSLFILEETLRRSVERRRATTGDGLEYGVLFGFGPGLTVEMVVLRSMPLPAAAAV